jgi:ABC-type polar amino acid transport system ATPase subunit
MDIARALCIDRDLLVFDEFTSFVDREIAKVSAFAISKAVRRSKKKFIAVTCHYDVVD